MSNGCSKFTLKGSYLHITVDMKLHVQIGYFKNYDILKLLMIA